MNVPNKLYNYFYRFHFLFLFLPKATGTKPTVTNKTFVNSLEAPLQSIQTEN